jgi:hypothetical protein
MNGLRGVIDGDGHFPKLNGKRTGLEIVMKLNDLPLLNYIKD